MVLSVTPETITKVEIWPMTVPITDPFVVATGRLLTAQNFCVRITLQSGVVGYGEIAPFPEVGGEDGMAAYQAAVQLANIAVGRPVTEYQNVAREFQEVAAGHPAARCALETALVDALSRERHVSLWKFWGARDVRERETDITIPIASLDRTVALARSWYRQGFRLFKMKVGMDVENDILRLEAVHRALADISFIVDANQGFTREQCQVFVKGVARFGARILLLEQPVQREELETMAALRRDLGIPIAADEAVQTLHDAQRVVAAQAADFVNIKIMKSGLMEAITIAAFVRGAGLRLMIGGMVETRVAMGCSFALVLGLGGFEQLDLDTPLLLSADPVKGGYRYVGPRLQPWDGPGLDVEPERCESGTTIE